MNYKALNKLIKNTAFIVLPIFYLLPAALLSLRFADINWGFLIITYFFILINQSLENNLFFSKITLKSKAIILEIVNIGLIIFFYINTSFFLGNLFLSYSILIHLQHLFKKFQLYYFAIILSVVFNLFLLNGISFYINTQFISFTYIWWVLPLFLPYLLVELDRWNKSIPIIKISLLLLSFIIGVITLWPVVGLWSLLIFFTLPSSFYTLKWNNYQGSIIFTLSFSIILLLILIFFT